MYIRLTALNSFLPGLHLYPIKPHVTLDGALKLSASISKPIPQQFSGFTALQVNFIRSTSVITGTHTVKIFGNANIPILSSRSKFEHIISLYGEMQDSVIDKQIKSVSAKRSSGLIAEILQFGAPGL